VLPEVAFAPPFLPDCNLPTAPSLRTRHTPQVVAEAYALEPVPLEPHVALSLVLFKMVSRSADEREDALHMLHVLSTREWQAPPPPMLAPVVATAAGSNTGTGKGWHAASGGPLTEADGGAGSAAGAAGVVVLGSLQDSYTQFQLQLAEKLARCGDPQIHRLTP
jgi:Cell morphogenesis central region